MPDRTVVLTRAREDNVTLRARLGSRGFIVVELPCIRIVPVDGGIDLGPVSARDLIVLTSRHAVPPVAAALGGARVPVAAIGAETRRHALAHGLEVRCTPSRADGATLGAELPVPEGRVILARSDRALPALAAALRARGAAVREVLAYHTVPTPPDRAIAGAVLTEGTTLVLASPSALDALLAALDAAEVARTSVLAIGPTTAAYVEHRLGVRPTVAAWNDIPEVLAHGAH